MDKAHFYERLMRWQHLRFNDVVLRERPDTPAWNKKYEIYILDNTRLSAQLYIRTTQPEENTVLVMEQYLAWLSEYNAQPANQALTFGQETLPVQRVLRTENCRRSPASPAPAFPSAAPLMMQNAQR